MKVRIDVSEISNRIFQDVQEELDGVVCITGISDERQ